jgi:hypothetical protein
VQGGHAGGEHRGVLAVLQARQLVLQPELVGAGLAGVDEQVGVVVVQRGRVVGQQV